MSTPQTPEDAVAVVGMAGTFPGAADIAVLTTALREGADLTGHCVEGVAEFAAGHFGMAPSEAAVVDPQHRMFLTQAWRAIESWGHRPGEQPGVVGVFGSASLDQYLLHRLLPAGIVPEHQGPEYLPLRTAHQLRLTGPAFAVQAACAGGLIAVAQAGAALQDYRCDTALAGGAALRLPEHRYDPALLSADGWTDAFATTGSGSSFASGAVVLVLRRLEDALADGDRVHAVLRGWAVTNDGRRGAGFQVPSVAGHREAVEEALAVAQVDPHEVDHVEAHGSGTPIGDALEIAALAQALDGAREVGVGSIKSTMGHLDAAAGPASLVKAVLMVRDGFVPPQPRPLQPADALTDSPFVLAGSRDDAVSRRPSVVGVSAIGIGGVNAHMIVAAPPSGADGRRPSSAASWETSTCWIGSAP